MKRRAFIQSLSTAGTLSLAGPAAWASVASTVGRPTLEPLFERLPQVLAAVERPVSTGLAMQAGFSDDWDLNLYPLVIGIGPRAERLLADLVNAGSVPADAGLYRTGTAPLGAATDWLPLRLKKATIAMLLVDPEASEARREASILLARRLVDAGVYLPLALVLGRSDHAGDAAWWRCLPLPTIEVQTTDPALDTRNIVEAMLPGLPFNQPTLVGVDLCDMRAALRAGPKALATAVRWNEPEGCVRALDRAWVGLPPTLCKGVLAWVNAGTDFSMGDFDNLLQALDARLESGAFCVLAPYIDPSLADGERLLSLTVVGD